MFNCTCCGTELSSPYFYNGGVYGWTCIKKVNPNARKNKAKSNIVEVEVLKVDFKEGSTRGNALISINGVKSCVTAYREYLDGVFSSDIQIGNFKHFNGKWWSFV